MVAPTGAEPAIVLQQRTPAKETWGGLWDVSVGGHYRAGEGLIGGLREIAEELGLEVTERDLIHVGWRREQAFYPNGLIEREIQDIYFLLRAVDLGALAPDPDEVVAVALVPARSLARLAAGRLAQLDARGGPVGAGGRVTAGTVHLTTEGLVPRSGDYYRKVSQLARTLASGKGRIQRRRWW